MNRRAPLFTAIGMVLLVIVVVVVAILPKMREVREKRDELEQEQQNEQFLLAELNRLQAARAQLPEVRRRLAKFNQRVPASADLPGLIRLMQNAADASNLVFFSISPSAPTPVGGATAQLPQAPPTDGGTVPPPVTSSVDASVIGAAVLVIGGFFEVDQFLFRLETLPRAAKVLSLDFAQGPDFADVPGQVSVTINLQVFTTDGNAGPGAVPDDSSAPLPGATTPAATTPAPTTTAPTTAAPTTTGG